MQPQRPQPLLLRLAVVCAVIGAALTAPIQAQGTIEFTAELTGVSPHTSGGSAHFTLRADGFLSGRADFTLAYWHTGAALTDGGRNLIRRATWTGANPDITREDLSPFNFMSATWDTIRLNPSEVSRLMSGEFYVLVPLIGDPDPNGATELFGQIIPVPEPRSWLLMLGGMVVILYLSRRRARPSISKFTGRGKPWRVTPPDDPKTYEAVNLEEPILAEI